MEKNRLLLKISMSRTFLLLSLSITCGNVAISASNHSYTQSFIGKIDSTNICNSDSVCRENTQYSINKHNFTDSKLYQMTFVGAPLIVTGLLMKGEDTHFRSLRNNYMKEFKHTYDNYSQYLPLAVMFGMKAAGVKSRDSWQRMLTSDVFSAAIMAGVVESVKRTTKVERPDGSDNRSFPSGHTATAFMTATMLSKEYGHLSPWISIGAYSVAAGTGMMRVANNKHWVSDVLTGAGVGIIATELGYYITDAIFKDKGKNIIPVDDDFSRTDHPSFFNIYIGANIPLSCYDIDESHEFRTSTGCTAGVEGAYFLNPYFGLGGRFTASEMHIITNKTLAEDNNSDVYSFMVGPYVSYPITSRWLVGSKLLAGEVTYKKYEMTDGTILPHNNGICFGSGLSFAYKARRHYGIRFFMDYNIMQPHSKNSGEWISTLAVGTGFGINF